MPKPRVFVSSVIEAFGEFRAAARHGIIEAGGEPVLVNEDFPALSSSSRNACLDAIDSSDIYLGIIGERGGWKAPSEKLVVEEEYERARSRRRPVLLFLQNATRDAEAERLARVVSDYVDGTFRKTFTSPGDLQREVTRALSPLISTREGDVITAPPELTEVLHRRSSAGSGEPILRVVIAPERREEVIDPVRFGSPEFSRELLHVGHQSSVALLDYAVGKESRVQGNELIIEQASSGRGHVRASSIRVSLSERGLLSADIVLDGRVQSNVNDLSAGLIIATEVVTEALRSAMSFYAAVIESLDPYKRHLTFFYNVALLDLGYRMLVRNPQPRSSLLMSMRSGAEPIVTFDEPRPISRQELVAPASEIERVITLLTRKAAAG